MFLVTLLLQSESLHIVLTTYTFSISYFYFCLLQAVISVAAGNGAAQAPPRGGRGNRDVPAAGGRWHFLLQHLAR